MSATSDLLRDFDYALAQMRHAYPQIKRGMSREFADGLVAPQIRKLERIRRELASGMSAGTAETQSGSGLQPASPTAESGDAQ